MTIRPGEPWGSRVARPVDLVVAADDAALARALGERATSGGPAVAVGGGDLGRTLGSPRLEGRSTLNALPLDLVEVRLDGGATTHLAAAHVTARRPWTSGGWLRGEALVVMNAEFLGRFDVAPRGHPNDGRVETFAIGAQMGMRERLAARRRARTGGHVPHPAITVRSVRRATWNFPRPLVITADGRPIGRARSLEIVVAADAGVVHA